MDRLRAGVLKALMQLTGRDPLQSEIGLVDGVIRDALIAQGCPHGCETLHCPYFRRLLQEGT